MLAFGRIRRFLHASGVSLTPAGLADERPFNGFLCIDEWSTGIEKYLQLSDEAKQGFFNFMDKTGIGLIDQKQFFETMKMSLTKEHTEKQLAPLHQKVATIDDQIADMNSKIAGIRSRPRKSRKSRLRMYAWSCLRFLYIFSVLLPSVHRYP